MNRRQFLQGAAAMAGVVLLKVALSPVEEPIVVSECTVTDWWDPNGVGLSVIGAWRAKGAADYATSLLDLTGSQNLVEGDLIA